MSLCLEGFSAERPPALIAGHCTMRTGWWTGVGKFQERVAEWQSDGQPFIAAQSTW